MDFVIVIMLRLFLLFFFLFLVAFFLCLGQTCSRIFFRFYFFFFADKQLPLLTFLFLLMCVRTKGDAGRNRGRDRGTVWLRAMVLGVSEFYSNLTLIKRHVTGLSSVTRGAK